MRMLSEILANVGCFPWLLRPGASCLQEALEGGGGDVGPPRCPLSPATSQQADIEQLDPRGRTPLHLATTLGHLECARVLLKHGADVGKENRSGWTGERGAHHLRPLPSCPGTDTDTDMGVLSLVLQLPREQLTRCYMHVAAVQWPVLLCHTTPRRAVPCHPPWAVLLSALQCCRRP